LENEVVSADTWSQPHLLAGKSDRVPVSPSDLLSKDSPKMSFQLSDFVDIGEAFAQALEIIPALVFITVDGKNVMVNGRYEEFTGRPAKALLGKGYRDIIHPDDRARLENAGKRSSLDHKTIELELRLRHASGDYRWMLCRSVPMDARDGERRVVLGTLIDIHDQKKTAEALAESEARLRYAQKAGCIGLWEWKVATDDVWWSPVMYELLGLEIGDGRSHYRSFEERIHSDDRDWVRDAMNVASHNGVGFDIEFRIVQPDGEVRWLAGRGETFGEKGGGTTRMIGVNFDVTERKLVEEQLLELNATLEDRVSREAEERERLWTLSQDLLVHARYDGKIVRANPAARMLLGENLSFLVGNASVDDAAQPARDMVAETRASGEPVRLSMTLATLDGSERQISWSIAPDTSNESFFAIGRDMTQIVEAQQTARQAEERLLQMQQTETLGQLASGLAHDFNNLLVPILGVLDMLKRRPQGDKDFDALIDGASHAALNARALVRRMLDFAQSRKVEPTPTDVSSLLHGMQGLLVHMLPSSIRSAVVCEPEMPPVFVHPDQLELSILNLAINARDAMPQGGRLAIRAHSTGKEVEIAVSDTGMGMDEATLKRATEPFYTTKDRGKGTGLGLFMAKQLAERSKGSLSIQSAAGEGTTIILRLPTVKAHSGKRSRENLPG
jgi:PAS domain S-box-containing protein